MGSCVISPPIPRLEPGVGFVGTMGFYNIGFCIKFPSPSYLEPRVDFININIIGCK